MQILKISPKGQITIPKEFRSNFIDKNLAFKVEGSTIILKPVKISLIDDDADFETAAESSLDFWKSNKDDIYEKYYLSESI
jgi:bifunctional DNA-binding transcriptional regulator/antitoxin component of YhaV-PrlF toxin-antitoxin module